MSENLPPFQEAPRCVVCSCSFTTFRRRHHCRCCGKTLCSEHSSYQMTLPQFGINTNVRVCYECFNKSSSVGNVSSDKISSATEGISKLKFGTDVDASNEQISAENNAKVVGVECKCGMPLCICEAPKPDPPIQVQNYITTSSVQNNPIPKKSTPERKSQPSSSGGSSSLLNLGQGNSSSSDKNTPGYDNSGEGLREAIKNGDVGAVKSLLSQGVDPKYCDSKGFTLLHLAALFNQTEIALILMDCGASVESKNHQGETPLDCAPTMLQFKMREKIKELSAD
ncbi:hypothetical protein LUZ60_006584 [Juncus effusus]|nr:hypothetical protein LUZ60_006584 [Juncus effusus]